MARSRWLLFAALLFSACPSNEPTECVLAVRDCRADEACVNGLCVVIDAQDAGSDARTTADGSADAGMDTCGMECDTGLGCELGVVDCSEDEPRCVRASLRPEGTVCRAAEGPCDADDVCDGASGGCALRRAPIGTPCDGGFCDGAGECGACAAGTPCEPSPCETGTIQCSASGVPSCGAPAPKPDGTTCGDETVGAFGACAWTDACAQTGTQERLIESPTCQLGACTLTTRSESQACSRSTEGNSCGDSVPGPWGTCIWADSCVLTGAQLRTVNDRVCSSGACSNRPRSETQDCTRATEGNQCGSRVDGPWSACAFTGCGLTGTQSRTEMQPSCTMGGCGNVTTMRSQSCTRTSSAGVSCGTPTYGPWGDMCLAFDCDPDNAVRYRSASRPVCSPSNTCTGVDDTPDTELCPMGTNVVGSFCTPAAGGFGTCSAPFVCTPTMLPF